MTAVVRRGTLVGLLAFCVACDAQRPTAPTSLFAPPSLASPAPPTVPAPAPGPPLTGPSTTYHFSAPLDYPVRGFTSTSRYVLFNNGAFSLRYESLDEGTFTGSYRQEDGRIIFDFGGDGVGSQGGQPEAIATIDGDLLLVRYSDMMQHSDFESAVYRRAE